MNQMTPLPLRSTGIQRRICYQPYPQYHSENNARVVHLAKTLMEACDVKQPGYLDTIKLR
jgi:hypothetical protein